MFKLRIYKLSGADKGNLDHEEFFSTREEMETRYNELFVYENYSLNPTGTLTFAENTGEERSGTISLWISANYSLITSESLVFNQLGNVTLTINPTSKSVDNQSGSFNLDIQVVEEFLSGDYTNELKIENPHQYKIENVAKEFLKLANN